MAVRPCRSVAGYSGTPLARKLGIRPGATVLLDGAPPDLRPRTGARRRPSAPAAQRRPVRRHRLLLPVQRPPVARWPVLHRLTTPAGRAVDRLAQAVGEGADRPRRERGARLRAAPRAGRRQGVRGRRRMVRPQARDPEGRTGDHSRALQRPARLGQRRLLGRPGRPPMWTRRAVPGTPAPAAAAGHRARPCRARTDRAGARPRRRPARGRRPSRARSTSAVAAGVPRPRPSRPPRRTPASSSTRSRPATSAARGAPDGLRHLPRPAARRPHRRAVRRARRCLADAVVWAALDCPGGWAVPLETRAYVLGELPYGSTRVPGRRRRVRGRGRSDRRGRPQGVRPHHALRRRPATCSPPAGPPGSPCASLPGRSSVL